MVTCNCKITTSCTIKQPNQNLNNGILICASRHKTNPGIPTHFAIASLSTTGQILHECSKLVITLPVRLFVYLKADRQLYTNIHITHHYKCLLSLKETYRCAKAFSEIIYWMNSTSNISERGLCFSEEMLWICLLATCFKKKYEMLSISLLVRTLPGTLHENCPAKTSVPRKVVDLHEEKTRKTINGKVIMNVSFKQITSGVTFLPIYLNYVMLLTCYTSNTLGE